MEIVAKSPLSTNLVKLNGGRPIKRWAPRSFPFAELIVFALGVSFLAVLINVSLERVPSSEVDRIYNNVGIAVKRTFEGRR